MTQIFDDQARAIPVTVIKAGPCHVVQIKRSTPTATRPSRSPSATSGPSSSTSPSKVITPRPGLNPPAIWWRSGSTSPTSTSSARRSRLRDVLSQGGLADVTGVSKGKGFQGVMRRHGFAGLGAAHGAHKKHRAPGSIGACATPARVFKGTKMAGRMGNDQVTTLNLQIVGIDSERDLLLLRGAVPGANGSLILVREAVKA